MYVNTYCFSVKRTQALTPTERMTKYRALRSATEKVYTTLSEAVKAAKEESVPDIDQDATAQSFLHEMTQVSLWHHHFPEFTQTIKDNRILQQLAENLKGFLEKFPPRSSERLNTLSRIGANIDRKWLSANLGVSDSQVKKSRATRRKTVQLDQHKSRKERKNTHGKRLVSSYLSRLLRWFINISICLDPWKNSPVSSIESKATGDTAKLRLAKRSGCATEVYYVDGYGDFYDSFSSSYHLVLQRMVVNYNNLIHLRYYMQCYS